jgi:hypothetical protein
MARDLMFQQEIKETVQRAYAAITGGAGEGGVPLMVEKRADAGSH